MTAHHFNPRGYESLDAAGSTDHNSRNISIHEATKASTLKRYFLICPLQFQSTRLRKPRLFLSASLFAVSNFNPRGYESLDAILILSCRHLTISIHEATKASTVLKVAGALAGLFQSTRLRKPRQSLYLLFMHYIQFQSTRLRKPRRCQKELLEPLLIFQSTRLRKPRPAVRYSDSREIYFNPRGYESLDYVCIAVGCAAGYFNPRGYESLDALTPQYLIKYAISIHEATKASTSGQF